jgi:integrase/recombinase XerD
MNILDIMMEFGANQEIIEKYSRYLVLQGNKEKTVNNRLRMLHVFFLYLKNKQISTITRDDIETYVEKIKKDGLKSSTQNEYIINIRLFVDWAVKKEIMPTDNYFESIALNKRERNTSKDNYYTRDDILAMLPHCKSQRDRALLSLMWDSGGRIGEMTNMDVKHFKKVDNHYIVHLNGKTGERDVIISSCVPDITHWLQQYGGKANDPLFPSNMSGRLQPKSIENIIRILVQKAGIDSTNKKVNPHSTRHGRITELADKGVPESHLRLFAGWDDDSDMPSRYIHSKTKAMMKSILAADGYKPAEIMATKPEPSMKPVKCSRCEHENPADAIYCSFCGNVINEPKVLEIQAEQKKDEEERMQKMIKDQLAGLSGTVDAIKQALESRLQGK